jgi:hypothetical protein
MKYIPRTLYADDSTTDGQKISQAFSEYFLSIAEQINPLKTPN